MAMEGKSVGTARGDVTSLHGLTTGDTGILDAVDLPIIEINRDCKVARVNRAATTVLGLTVSDIGQSPGNILPGIEGLDKLCAQVIADGAQCRRETRAGDRSFLLRIAPYITSDHQIVGAVLTFTNVTAFRASIDQAIYEREFTKAILNTVIDPLVVLDAKLRVRTANRAFYALFGVSRDETQGVSIRKIGNHKWETSEVWESIETTLSGHADFSPVEIDREFPAIGRRTLVLDARRLTRDGDAMILLAFQDVTERKQAERATSLLAGIVDSSDDAIVSKNLDGIITSWNAGAERTFGYKAHEAVGQHITLIIPSDLWDEETGILRRIRSGERVNHFETVRKRKDGTLLNISATISPVKDAAGRVIGASKVARDVTEHRRVERAIAEQARLLDLSFDAIFVRDALDRITYWNNGAIQLYGYTSEEALGRVSHELLRTEFPEPLGRIFEQLRGNSRWTGELTHKRKDGISVIVASRWALDRGNQNSILEINSDITRQKQGEKALRESEERFRAIVETTPECVKLVAPDGTLLHMNSSGLTMVGADCTEAVVGKSIYDLIDPNDRDRFRSFNERICRGEKDSLEFGIVGLDGVGRQMETHAAPLRNPDGTVVQLGVTRDVTERNRAEEELRKSEERFRTLAEALDAQVQLRTQELEQRNCEVLEQAEQLRELSNRLLQLQDDERRHIARELHDSAGQIITALAMSLANISRDMAQDPRFAKHVQDSQDLVRQLNNEIRTMSYLLHPPLLDESGLPGAVRWYIEGLTERSGLKIDLDIGESFGRLPGEMELGLFRIMQECLTNVHRHSGSKKATIRISRQADRVSLEIEDQGKGMSPEKLVAIQRQRSGVGITGIRERVRHFGGLLNIQSSDCGTRISVTIPASAASVAAISEPQTPSRQSKAVG